MVTYESVFGNTKIVAEQIIEGLKEVAGVETVLSELRGVDLNQLVEFDAILVGSPNHMGGATRGVRKFINELGKLNLKGKQAALFDTYGGKDYEKVVKKMERQISEKAPELKLLAPGLSVKVKGMKGPIAEGELPKCKEFGVKIATLLSHKA